MPEKRMRDSTGIIRIRATGSRTPDTSSGGWSRRPRGSVEVGMEDYIFQQSVRSIQPSIPVMTYVYPAALSASRSEAKGTRTWIVVPPMGFD